MALDTECGSRAPVFPRPLLRGAGTILTLITLGKFLEARAKGKTSDAINKLLNLAPKTATILRNGVESIIPIEEVEKDDILIVKAGESIPVDGIPHGRYGLHR